MSLINSIAKFKKPIGEGIARRVYYSKKHNVVVKVTKSYRDEDQSYEEKKLFEKMTKREKEVFPVLQTIEYKGRLYIVMKKCTPVNELDVWGEVTYSWTPDSLCVQYGLDTSNNATLLRMRRKYCLGDLHTANLGVDEKNRLVILDAGM